MESPRDHDTGKPIQTEASQYTAATETHPGFATGLEEPGLDQAAISRALGSTMHNLSAPLPLGGQPTLGPPVTAQRPTVGRLVYFFDKGNLDPLPMLVVAVKDRGPNTVPRVCGWVFGHTKIEPTGWLAFA